MKFSGFGKAALKFLKASPDGMVQMAMQVALVRMFQRSGRSLPMSTYESVGTLMFYHGRTETGRSVTVESVRLCDELTSEEWRCGGAAMVSAGNALNDALSAHASFVQDAAMGRGIDRHLMGLKIVASSSGEDFAIFRDPVYARASDWSFSTSHLPNGASTGVAAEVNGEMKITATEPSVGMRSEIPQLKNVDVIGCAANELPVPDASVDAVFAAQAFHWFANEDVLAECSRVLRPGGTFGCIWNQMDSDVEWVRELRNIYTVHENGAPQYRLGLWRAAFPNGLELPSEERRRHFPDDIPSQFPTASFSANKPKTTHVIVLANIHKSYVNMTMIVEL